MSGVNGGGRIYRSHIGEKALEVWQPGGVDGRTTARGIDVDSAGRVFVAGGPGGRLWVFSAEGARLAALATAADTFLNDVAEGVGRAHERDARAPFASTQDAAPGRLP